MLSCQSITENSPCISPYISYCYSYPHKSTYSHFEKPIPLKQLWMPENRNALFLYVHIPFCETRCSFCNLLSLAGSNTSLKEKYVATLLREARSLGDCIDPATFNRMAYGGGTPSYLSSEQLHSLVYELPKILKISPRNIPCSFEVSPSTLTAEKAAILADAGIDRISIGIQTFNNEEVRKLGRCQSRQDVESALDLIRQYRFNTLNIDLIYGCENQDIQSWRESLKSALAWKPEELYLYPLYIRPQTGLADKNNSWADNRLRFYRIARDFLQENNYVQKSKRMFCLKNVNEPSLPEYVCQTDGMIGLGCGARSYTGNVHYSSTYAVDRAGVESIIRQYIEKDHAGFSHADYGYTLDREDRFRRYIIKTLLRTEGFSRKDFFYEFNVDVLDVIPQIIELSKSGLAIIEKEKISLTQQGLELSDAIGPWLFSKRVKRLMELDNC